MSCFSSVHVIIVGESCTTGAWQQTEQIVVWWRRLSVWYFVRHQ